MKHPLTFIAKLSAALVFAFAATIALAWTDPGTAAPNGNVPAPVNTGNIFQIKNESFGVTKNLYAAQNVFGSAVFGDLKVSSLHGIFGCDTTLGGCLGYTSPNVLEAGKHTTTSSGNTFDAGLQITGLGKLLSGSGNLTAGNWSGAIVDPNGDLSVGKRTNWNLSGLLVSDGQTTVTGPFAVISGNPGAGKVLTSDASGNATWQPASAASQTGSVSSDGLITYVRTGLLSGGSAEASCPSDSIVIGGGGYCEDGIAFSQAKIPGGNVGAYSGNGPSTTWRVSCLTNVQVGPNKYVSGNGGTTHSAAAEAICMRKVGLATSTGSSTGGGSPTNPTTPASWHWFVAHPNYGYNGVQGTAIAANPPADGALGQSCEQWLAGGAYATAPVRAYGHLNFATLGDTAAVATGSCAYQYTAQASVGGGYTSSCFSLAKNSVVANARPVKSCSDQNAFGTLSGVKTSIKMDFFTEVQY